MSDIHANLLAFEAVLADAASRGDWNGMWVLGDSVGYGAQPNECVERLRAEAGVVIAGNHEQAAVGKIDVSDFNPYAARAAMWTADALTQENRAYLASLPLHSTASGCTLVHGSPRDPVWEYLLSADVATANLRYFDTPGCLVGHSHMPFLLRMKLDEVAPAPYEPQEVVEIGADRFYLNPGSVGQPRDGDPRASYAMLDPMARTVEFRRVEYDIRQAQRLIEQAGLPQVLAERLALGR